MNIFLRIGRRLTVGSVAVAVALVPVIAVPAGAVEEQAAPATVVLTAECESPTISGTAKVGETLTAPQCEGQYQWYAGEAPISGAIGETLTLAAAQKGQVIRVDIGGVPSAPTQPVAEGTLMVGNPKLTGTVAVGSKITADPGAWTKGTTFTYQWYLGSNPIKDATDKAFVPAVKHKDQPISVTVTGTLEGYALAEKASNTATVKAGTLKAPKPTVSGTPKVGKKLTANAGTWTKGTTFTYQWYLGGNKIKGATGKTLTLTAAHKDKGKLSVSVTGKLEGYASAEKASDAITVKTGTLTKGTPKISGTAKFNKKLTAKPGSWTKGTKFSYQWYANGKKIKGATKSTYTLNAAQTGKKITVKVTGSKPGYAKATQTSKATKKVATAALKTAKPTVSGSVIPGHTLVVNPGTWTKGTKFSYQWYANGKKIKGATGKSFYVSNGHINSAIKVKVTGSKAGYKTASKSSSRKGVSWRMPTGDQPNLKNYKNLSVEVSIAKQRVYIKSGAKVIYEMRASTGMDATPTVRGTFSIKQRGPQFMNPSGVGARYWVRFYEEYLFHAVPMDRNGNYLLNEAAKLGSKASHGCIRLSVADAIWFYQQIPVGVKVKVY